MKRITFFLFILFSVSASHVNAQIIHCLWQTSPVIVDGKPDEWPQPFNYYDGNTKLQFAFANDTANIYVCLKITDDPTQLRLFNGGLGIWIDPRGKKKETMGISFPLKAEGAPGEGSGGGKHRKGGEEGSEPDPSAQKADALRLKQHAFLTQTTLRVKGFMGVPEQVLPLKNDFGLNVAFNWDSLNILTIEYKFPVALVLGHPLSPADTLKPISVAFIEPALEAVKLPSNEEDNTITGPSSNSGNNMYNRTGSPYNNMGGMNSGAGGMGGGMGGRGGSHASSLPSQNPATMEQKLWSKVILVLTDHSNQY